MSAASISAIKLVGTAVMKPDVLSAEKAAGAAETYEIMALAYMVTFQFYTGKRREIGYTDYKLFECIEPPYQYPLSLW